MKYGYYKLKTWEEMGREFGVECETCKSIEIPGYYCFTKQMEESCPDDRVVLVENYIWECNGYTYRITHGMISKYY